MKKVLIVNAVPVNIGDAALVLSIYDAIEKQGLEVAIASHRFKLAHQYNPDARIVRDLLDYPIIKRLPIIRYFLIPFFVIGLKHYREADFIVGAPGGYINSYYRLFDKLYVLFVCKMLGKKTAIYSQSIGPLNSKDAKYFSFFLKHLDLLYARDSLSYENAQSLGGSKDNIVLTQDAAFLLEPKSLNPANAKRVAVSVRDWSHDSRNSEQYYALIAEMIKFCLRKGYSVEFLSTCQGIPGYVDDSKVAEKIIEKHLQQLENVTIDQRARTLDEFRTKLHGYDFVIGTRLHMCILSMLSGVPAFNISYEVKGKECYAYLGLANYSVDYNAAPAESIKALDDFTHNLDKIQSYTKERVAASHTEAQNHFESFCSNLGLV